MLLLLTFSAKAQQMFWRITGPHAQSPSYLLGTTYSTAPAAFNFNDSVLIALQQAQGFAMEVDYDSLTEGIRRARYEPDEHHEIRSLLSKEEYNFADQLLFQKNKLHIEDFGTRNLRIIASRINGNDLIPLVGPEYPQFWLSLQADKLGKPSYSLEKVQNQLEILFPKTVTPAFKKEFLMNIGYLPADGSSPDLHLATRAKEMAAKLSALFKTESIFAAVDTLYLSALIRQLRLQGYKVNPVNAPTTAFAMQEREKLDKNTWFILNKKEQGFSVQLPSYPIAGKNKGQTNEKIYIGGNNSSGGAVIYQDIMDLGTTQDSIFAEELTKHVTKEKVTDYITKRIEYKGHPGIDASYSKEEALASIRIYMVNNRLFTFIFSGKDSASLERFLHSIVLYDNPSKAVYDTFAFRGGAATVIMPENRSKYKEGIYTDTYKAVDNEHHIFYSLSTYLPPAGGNDDERLFMQPNSTKPSFSNNSKIDSISYQRNGLQAYTIKYKHANGFISRKDVIKQNTATFTLISTYNPANTDSSYVTRFFHSFQLKPFSYKANWTTFTDEDSSFSVQTPVEIYYKRFSNGWSGLSSDKKMVYTSWDTATQCKYRISVLSFTKPDQDFSSVNFNAADSSQIVVSVKKDNTIELQQKDHLSREYRKTIISGQTIYVMQAFMPEEMAKSDYAQRFFNSFVILGKAIRD